MANFDLDTYIKDMGLSPELEAKARQCKTGSELLDLAAENDIELPMEALDAVSGGCDSSHSTCAHVWRSSLTYRICQKYQKVERVKW